MKIERVMISKFYNFRHEFIRKPKCFWLVSLISQMFSQFFISFGQQNKLFTLFWLHSFSGFFFALSEIIGSQNYLKKSICITNSVTYSVTFWQLASQRDWWKVHGHPKMTCGGIPASCSKTFLFLFGTRCILIFFF